ncbi:MAG: RecQ family ATP-dependent DNA helicase [Burkholderiales bacterium]|nr:RecQ family ATP-dependent DNA helicase [Burkholderiales bacterium]OJX06280.1 MAG: recombinase RecQ [Burkholderiales bacterium 70-64]
MNPGSGLLDPVPHVASRPLPAGVAFLSIDVESHPGEGNRIFRLAAVRSDREAIFDAPVPPGGREAVARRLNAYAAGAGILVGHNLRRHDLPALAAQLPGLDGLHLPVVDTLELSPLAFPRNPYHRLVKDYKLVSDSRNDPVGDAHLALELLADELHEFARLHLVDPGWVGVLHFLLHDDPALARLFGSLREAPPPTLAETQTAVRGAFPLLCCETRLDRLVQDDLAGDTGLRWPIAYALAWLRVAGGNSVLPPWVHAAHPGVGTLIRELRETDCSNPQCRYCRQQHDPESLLLQHFQLDAFRAKPANATGGSLQRDIVETGLQRRSLLAILPTGGGKSICYQLPALAHYWRSGKLTVIVSPLQSLMKDQVDNLVAHGVQCVVTINGLLTSPERKVTLEKIRMGDAGIVLVSPEQFRNRRFVEAIRLRQIATWVFDEAHCLSKWGHDFRTDYLYVARFIREHFAEQAAPVACFTATAKPDVVDDLIDHFREQLGVELQYLPGGHERANLEYVVMPVRDAEKGQHIQEILARELRNGGAGIVFCARRDHTEIWAEQLARSGMRCRHFHAGLDPGEKKKIQQDFIAGGLDVIVATNAFGMGVDKPDVRVVVHADIPGSLENYLQEAGRAGRDGHPARCVLLFAEQDVEAQFRLAARSQLNQRDFAGLLRSIRRRAQRFRSDEIVVSAKELLLDAEGVEIDVAGRDAATKVQTAVAWLERSGFLKRNENHSRVFPASLRIPTLAEAISRIRAASLKHEERERYEAVAAALYRCETPEGLSTDDLQLAAGIDHKDCFRILCGLEQLDILANDLGLTALVSKGVQGASDRAFERLVRFERALLDLMSEFAPDAAIDDAPQLLGVRAMCSELRRRLDLPVGHADVHPARLHKCLRSLAESFGSDASRRASMQVRRVGTDSLRIELYRGWREIREICEKRQAAARVVLAALLARLPPDTRQANVLVECKAKELLDALDADLALRTSLRDPAAALEHALLYLHENDVIQLDKGRTVFRAAMTIELNASEAKRRFRKEDFAPLQEHYRERTFQTHVMHEYAKRGAQKIADALALTAAYFTWPRRRFVKEWFAGRTELIELATTAESYRRIVDKLGNPAQQRLVTKPDHGNHLVLAGPGSGKTRVLVHRIAWLLRVRRVAPTRIIALAFNRSAAAELRRRLFVLVGDDARGVTVMTHHALALRLTGTSLAGADLRGATIDFARLLSDAVDLLEGRTEAFADADEARDRLLAGYEYIFVDEYQDIDAEQYALVSALAGRRLPDGDGRLSIMAVGDDDQNIYAFNGANVEFIRRFREDYDAEVSWLVENYRSTQHIIGAANHVIQPARDRMKVDHPIRIDARRADDPAGGRWSALDAQYGGRVRLIDTPADANRQAQLVAQEIARIRGLDPRTALGDIAVLARTHESLEPLRALCEIEGIRCSMARDAAAEISVMQTREGRHLLDVVLGYRRPLLPVAALVRWLRKRLRARPANCTWQDLCAAGLDLMLAYPKAKLPLREVADWFFESAGTARRDGAVDALRLMTAHRAKGLEFRHVIVMDCDDWGSGDDERRLLYVAMTRARETLTVFRRQRNPEGLLADLHEVDTVVALRPEAVPPFRPELQTRCLALSPSDVDLGFAGRHPQSHRVHADLAALGTGDRLRIVDGMLETGDGRTVGRLSKGAGLPNGEYAARVTAVMVRTREQTPPQYLDSVRVDRWEVVLAEAVATTRQASPRKPDSIRLSGTSHIRATRT